MKRNCDSGSGLRLNDDPDAKLSSVGWFLMLVFDCDHRWFNLRISLALIICESSVKSFLCGDALHMLGKSK